MKLLKQTILKTHLYENTLFCIIFASSKLFKSDKGNDNENEMALFIKTQCNILTVFLRINCHHICHHS